MAQWIRRWRVVALAVGLAACAHQAPPHYDSDSWRRVIDASCQRFFDGCNTCTRAGDGAACTRKACAEYQKPRCLDERAEAQASPSGPLHYQCTGGSRFTVYVGQYTVGDQRVSLDAGQVMLVDEQTRAHYLLSRERSGSGAKFTDGALTYWSKGREALVEYRGEVRYQQCRIAH